jgi:hypothetical protein
VKKKKQKPGPKEERLIIPGKWREAVKKSFDKEKPTEGWPVPQRKKNG